MAAAVLSTDLEECKRGILKVNVRKRKVPVFEMGATL